MELARAVWSEALEQRTPYVALGAVVAAALTRRQDPEDRKRIKTLWVLVAAHVVLAISTGVLRAVDSALHTDLRIPSLSFGALAAVTAGGAILFRGILPRLRVRAPRIVHDVTVAGAGIVAVLAMASRSGLNLSGVVATSAVITAVVGLALQDTLGNVLGGLALQTDESIQVDDWIKVGDVVGRVVDIRWRYTAVETRNWETVVIPNSVLLKNQVTVLGRRRGQPVQWRRWVWFTVPYRHAPADVLAAVSRAFVECDLPNVAAAPPPNVLLMEFASEGGRYALRYWLTDLAVDDPTDAAVRQRIFYALQRAGMRIAAPHYDVTVAQQAERAKARLAVDAARRETALDDVALFSTLPADERHELAATARWSPFAAGETLTRQGAVAHWLYVVVSGECAVRVQVEGQERDVATVGPGEFFGEMSLLTGAPRSATVIAITEVMCWRLEREAFRQLLARRPAFAEDVADVIAIRQGELDDVREDLSAAAKAKRREARKRDLAGSIRSFLGLDDAPPSQGM